MDNNDCEHNFKQINVIKIAMATLCPLAQDEVSTGFLKQQ